MNKIDFLLRGKCGVYVIINIINGKRYVGAANDIYARLHGHQFLLNHNSAHNAHFQKDWCSYGEDAFIFSPLEFCNKDILRDREQYYIDSLKPEYNLSLNVIGNIGREVNEELRAKISNTLKAKYASGEIQTYKQQHLWVTVYIYNIKTFKLVAVCKNKATATKLLGASHFVKEGSVYRGKYIIRFAPFKDYNELRNYINQYICAVSSRFGKYIICEDDTLHYYRSLPECAEDNRTSKHNLVHYLTATKECPHFLRQSGRNFYYHDEYIPVQYDAVPIEKSSELLSGKIGEGCDANTEINSEITKGSESL